MIHDFLDDARRTCPPRVLSRACLVFCRRTTSIVLEASSDEAFKKYPASEDRQKAIKKGGLPLQKLLHKRESPALSSISLPLRQVSFRRTE